MERRTCGHGKKLRCRQPCKKAQKMLLQKYEKSRILGPQIKQSTAFAGHRFANTIRHEPSGFVAHAKHALQLSTGVVAAFAQHTLHTGTASSNEWINASFSA